MSDDRVSSLRALMGADAWLPSDLPEQFSDSTQESRAERMEQLQREWAALSHEHLAQATVDTVVEELLRKSFPEASAHE